jgi:hypothetical protein
MPSRSMAWQVDYAMDDLNHLALIWVGMLLPLSIHRWMPHYERARRGQP